MAGGGFMHEASKRNQQNRAMSKRDSLFNYSNKSISPVGEVNKEEIPPITEEQKEYVNQLIVKRKAEERVRFIKRITISIVGGCLLAFILWSWMQV